MKERPLERHHKIWKCLAKVFPQSKGLREAIKSPKNIQMVTHQEHVILNRDTPEIFNYLKKEVKGKRIKESIIYRNDQFDSLDFKL